MKKMNILGIIAIIAVIGLSMASCGETECAYEDHTWENLPGQAATITEDGYTERECTTCGFYEDTVVPALNTGYLGTWTNTASGGGTTHTIVISNTEFKITTSGGTDHFTVSDAVWANASSAPTGFTGGYTLTGTITQSGTSWPAANTSVSIYLSTNGSTLRWRLTAQDQSREFTRPAPAM